MTDDRKLERAAYRYIELGQVGMEMVAPIIIGLMFDNWLGWRPWLTVVGVVAGFVGGMAHLLAFRNRRANGPGSPHGDQP
jgi:hypothetical protein